MDITPRVDQERRVLFLPDAEAAYDFETARRRNNVRQAITNNRLVTDYIAIHDHLHRLIEENSTGLRVELQGDALSEMRHLYIRASDTEHQLRAWLLKTAGRNDPCPCGSGAKFKKCCAR